MFYVGGVLMNSKTLSNFHKFGKVGKIAMTVLMVIAILAAAASCVATIFVSTLPKDALTVRVTNHAEFRINEKNSIWNSHFSTSHFLPPKFIPKKKQK